MGESLRYESAQPDTAPAYRVLLDIADGAATSASERSERHLRRSAQSQEFPAQTATDRLIFVTNRGPIEFNFGKNGAPEAQRGAGGVVSGLLGAARGRPVSWISLAMNDADRAIAQSLGDAPLESPAGLAQLSSRLVDTPQDAYHRYYDGFSNGVLWFMQHGMRRPQPQSSDATTADTDLWADWEQGYAPVNEAVAQSVLAELARTDPQTPVIFHDYHLYLAPERVRQARPNARLLHFIHIPWPSLAHLATLPAEMARAIYSGLLANDVIGFQTARDASNFLDGVARYLPGAYIVRATGEVRWRGRRIRAQVFPIAITPAMVLAAAESPAAQAQADEIITPLRGADMQRKIILRVDRVEPTKNIVCGFDAYERLLDEHPEWRERVTFLALLVPSRESLAAYREYADHVRAAIERINRRFATADWTPIVALFGNDHARALACMREYDALLVNPLADGMNLVVKEAGLLNQRNGVTVLSRMAGAYAQLRSCALGVEPTDSAQTAERLLDALTMPRERRAALSRMTRAILSAESAETWLTAQLTALDEMTRPDAIAPAASVAAVALSPAPAAHRPMPALPPVLEPTLALAQSRDHQPIAAQIDTAVGGLAIARRESERTLNALFSWVRDRLPGAPLQPLAFPATQTHIDVRHIDALLPTFDHSHMGSDAISI